MLVVFTFLLALLLSAALVPICAAVARRFGYVLATTRGQAALRPRALFGGVGVVLTVLGCAAAIGVFRAVPILFVCTALLCLVGLASDLSTLKPSAKLVAIIAVASVFLFFDYRLHWSESLTFDSMLTLFWVVGVTSAFNLLDNMDGLCGGIAVIAGVAFLSTMLPLPADGPLLLRSQYVALLLGAIAGLLVYNVHPASVVMGEAGSLAVGFNMAALTLQVAPGRGSDLLSVIAVPVLILLIPIADATLVAVSRLMAKAPFAATAGRDHSSHRLIALGLSERSAVTLLWLLAAASGFVAVVADSSHPDLAGLLAAMFTIAMALFAVYLARVRVHDKVDPNALPATIMPLGIDLGYRRRLAEVMLDLLLVSVAYYWAYRLQNDPAQWPVIFPYFIQSFPVVLCIQMLALVAVGAYHGIWRHFSLSDGVTFSTGVFLGVVTSQIAVLYLYRFEGYSPATFIVYGLLLLILLVGSRASFRFVSEFVQRQRQVGRRLVIYGADDTGSIAIRFLNSSRAAYRIVGFVDDDPGKRNARVHGYRVIGGYDHLMGMIMAGEVDDVALTRESVAGSALPWLCSAHGVALHQVTIDWREVRSTEAVAIGEAVAGSVAEAKVLRFTDTRRDRADAESESSSQSLRARQDAVAPGSEGGVRPTRVAHVITRLILGGAQENTLYTAVGQHRDPRFDVTLICGIDEAGEGNMYSEANRAGVRTVVLPSLLREIRPLTDVKALFDLYRLFRRGGYDIVHTHSSKAGIVGRLAARCAGVPIVVHTVHGMAFHEFQSAWKNRLYVALERLCAPLSHRIISVSDRLVESALGERIGRRDQHVKIFSGIELELFLSVRDRLTVADAKRLAGIPPDAPVVGKVARMFPLKGHDQFLAAATEIARLVPEAFFLLVGDGPLRNELRAKAEHLGLSGRLVMAGRVPPERVPDYLQAMDVVVHTSLREGIARVLPQAGAVGKPVVTFALDGAPEVIRHGVSGYLVPALDTNHLAERTVELLHDAERRTAFGEAGRAYAAEHFSIEGMVERINGLYIELLGGRTDAP